MDEVEEIVNRIRLEIEDYLKKGIIGIRHTDEELLLAVRQEIIARYYSQGFNVEPINLRIEGELIKWDGIAKTNFKNFDDIKRKKQNG